MIVAPAMDIRGPLLLTWFNLNPAWVSNHMPRNVSDEITYSFPNFNACIVESFKMDK